MHKFMWVGQKLRYQMMLVVVFEVVALLESFVVRSCCTFNVGNEAFVLEVHLPILFVIIAFGSKIRLLTG